MARDQGSHGPPSKPMNEARILMSATESNDFGPPSASVEPSLEIDSVALQRLIDEVRTTEPVVSGNYNRTYNRHNR